MRFAIASKAKYFITGDKNFTESIILEYTQIISVSQFRVLIT